MFSFLNQVHYSLDENSFFILCRSRLPAVFVCFPLFSLFNGMFLCQDEPLDALINLTFLFGAKPTQAARQDWNPRPRCSA